MGLIDGFRMPLMFILSAMTCKYSTDFKSFKKNTIKAVKHLLTPALLIFAFYFIYNICKNPSNFSSWQYWESQFFVLIYYAGVPVKTNTLPATVSGIGTPWFFVALLVSRILFDLMQMSIPKKLHIPTVITACCIGVALGKHEIFVLSFDIVLAVLPFLYVGYRYKEFKDKQFTTMQKVWGIAVCVIVFVSFSLLTYKEFFNLAWRTYPLFPICFFAAIAGSIVVMLFSKLLEKVKIFYPLQFLGQYSIYFYAVHCIDSVWKEWYTRTTNSFLNFLIRVAIDLVFFLVLVGLHISITKIMQHRKMKKQAQKLYEKSETL